MATGDVNDFINRLNKLLSPWFGEQYPLLNSLLTGYATMDAFIYSLTEYLTNQMRIQTAMGENLDLIACDYFEGILSRTEGMSDDIFRNLIQCTLIEEMCTVQGMKNALFNLTGYYPVIWEPWDSSQTGAYNVNVWGYNNGGAYGDNAPYQFWIEVFVNEPSSSKYGGFNTNTWGYNKTTVDGSNGAYSGQSGTVLTYDQILAVVNRVKVGGTVPNLTVTYI